MSTLVLKVIMYVPFQSVTLGLKNKNIRQIQPRPIIEVLMQDCALRKIEGSPVL